MIKLEVFALDETNTNQMRRCQFVTLCMPTFICHFVLPGRVLLLLLPRRVVVAIVATATSSYLCAVVAEPLSFSIPSLLPIFHYFRVLLCVSVEGMQAMIEVWTSLSSDTASSDHIVCLSLG